jgi:hypothetical protein
MKFPKARHQNGSAVLLLLGLLALVFVAVAANSSTVHYLGRDVQLLEERQQRHWTQFTPPAPAKATNATPALAP